VRPGIKSGNLTNEPPERATELRKEIEPLTEAGQQQSSTEVNTAEVEKEKQGKETKVDGVIRILGQRFSSLSVSFCGKKRKWDFNEDPKTRSSIASDMGDDNKSDSPFCLSAKCSGVDAIEDKASVTDDAKLRFIEKKVAGATPGDGEMVVPVGGKKLSAMEDGKQKSNGSSMTESRSKNCTGIDVQIPPVSSTALISVAAIATTSVSSLPAKSVDMGGEESALDGGGGTWDAAMKTEQELEGLPMSAPVGDRKENHEKSAAAGDSMSNQRPHNTDQENGARTSQDHIGSEERKLEEEKECEEGLQDEEKREEEVRHIEAAVCNKDTCGEWGDQEAARESQNLDVSETVITSKTDIPDTSQQQCVADGDDGKSPADGDRKVTIAPDGPAHRAAAKRERRKNKEAQQKVKNRDVAALAKLNATQFRSHMSMDKTYEGVVEHIENERARVRIEKSSLMGYFPITPGTVFAFGQTVVVRMSVASPQNPTKTWAPVEMLLVSASPCPP
jgi:hypothetical protein